jgi:hypothetical protein
MVGLGCGHLLLRYPHLRFNRAMAVLLLAAAWMAVPQ